MPRHILTDEDRAKGQRATSPAKRDAARENANKPPKPGKRDRGRPRKTVDTPDDGKGEWGDET